MPGDAGTAALGGRQFERVLGRIEGECEGPTVVVFGGIHGNEPAGALAAQRVVEELRSKAMPLRGRFLALAGNREAMRRGRRYVHRDLNRKWEPEEIARLRSGGLRADTVEDREQAALLEHVDEAISLSDGPVIFLDLHSTSGEGPPFACLSDTLRNRRIALAMPLPVLLGLEEVIDGTMLGYLSDLGHCGVAVEGGQHEHPDTVAQHVSAIWLCLVAAGSLRPEEVRDLAKHRARLERATAGHPRVVDIRHRHVVGPDDAFVMADGFASFQPLAAGTVVARDVDGDVRSPMSGLMLLPRYQGQGEDGYFVAREISFAWLVVSAALRRLRLDRLAGLLPGVHRHPVHRDRLVVSHHAPGRLMTNLLHLFGYRRVEAAGSGLVFSRRRPDGARPLGLPRPLSQAAVSPPSGKSERNNRV